MKRLKSFCFLSAWLALVFTPVLLQAGSPFGLTILSPTADLNVSNVAFTVTGLVTNSGTATNEVTVTNVLYSLNSGAWTNAETSDNWTNWSAQVTLKPGTNTLSAAAQDSDGNYSEVSTVKFVYVAFDTLAVHANGPGTISPNYDGASLQLGVNYSMTASTTATGYAFRNWSDASNNVITTGATLTFKMASNLVLTANFLDAVAPALKVLSYKVDKTDVSQLTITGIASDNIFITNVLTSVNGNIQDVATTTDNWANWTAQVTLEPGTNFISVWAVDGGGNCSPTNKLKQFYPKLATLTVLTNGNITLSPNLNGAQLLIGKNYFMTGKSPVKGFGARTWTDADGNIVGDGPGLTFMMKSNLVLTANYGDVAPPGISITGASTNSDGDFNSVVFYGKASDNVAVAGLSIRLGDFSKWFSASEASTTNNWTNWSVVVRGLLPGQTNFFIRSVDTSSNVSYAIPVVIYNNTAPSILAGKSAILQPSDSSTAHTLHFGKSTFSQYSTDTKQITAVGKYSFSHSAGNGFLKLTYLAPPAAARAGTRTIGLYFTTPVLASYVFTNSVLTDLEIVDTNSVPAITNTISTNQIATNYGTAYFVAASTLAPAKWLNQLVYTVGDDATNARGVLLEKGTFSAHSLLGQETNGGKFKYKAFSPVSGLFTFSRANGTEYLVVTHSATNQGYYYAEDYDLSGNTNGITRGRFMVSLPQPGGNAPASVTDHTFQIFSGGESFNVTLGDSTYSQDTASTNLDNAVGGYAYGLDGTNVGQLDLTVAEPPQLAGSNTAARLIFVSGNAGLFTNQDGTISTFALSAATNFALTSVDSRSFSLYNSGSYFPSRLSFTNGQFELVVQDLYYSTTHTGAYTYSVFSPRGAMARLNYTWDSTNYGNDWLQFNFTSATNGSIFANGFDSLTNFEYGVQGTFQSN